MSDDLLLFDLGPAKPGTVRLQVEDRVAEVKPYVVENDTTVVPLPFTPLTGATFSEDRIFRYHLWRKWAETGTTCTFALLNPSTADEIKNDPTVERCERYARAWGHAQLVVVNIFAFRATLPKDMRRAIDPIGPLNDEFIADAAKRSAMVVCGWGNHGKYMFRDTEVLKILREHSKNVFCLKKNKNGSYGHPLYLRKDLVPSEI